MGRVTFKVYNSKGKALTRKRPKPAVTWKTRRSK